MRVVYLQRRVGKGVYSLEGYFEIVRRCLPGRVEAAVAIAPHESRGIWPRIANIFWARRRQADVNHITGDIHYVSYFLRKRRTILTVLDCGFTQNPSSIRATALRILWLTIPEKRVSVITTISEFTRQQVIANTGCDPSKVRVVYACVSPGFKPIPKEFNSERPTILLIGTTNNKNLERLCEALVGVNCHIHVVGALSASQKAALVGSSYTNSVDLSAEEMLKAYADSDLVAFVSTYEGFGLPIVEANATGRAVVTSRVTSMPEIAADAACLVDPFDVTSIREGILRVLRCHEYRDRLIANGLRNRNRFDPKVIATQYVEIYDSVMKTDGAAVHAGSTVG